MTEAEAASGPVPVGIRPGSLLADRYAIDRTIASGGMGALFLATDRVLDRPVAVKVLHPHLAGTAEARRFLSEGRVLASLVHPNLAAVYDMDAYDDLPYLVMEYVEGESLASILERDGPPPLRAAIAWALQICDALEYIHARGVVHRDVKPQNLLLTPIGQIKMVDFGIARAPEMTEMTAPGSILGTAHYLPPEIAAGEGATPQSDLYSLGVVLYRLFTGRLPFAGDDALVVAMAHRAAPVPAPSEVAPGLPRAVEEILLRLLEKEPSRRYGSAADVAAALAGVRATLEDDE